MLYVPTSPRANLPVAYYFGKRNDIVESQQKSDVNFFSDVSHLTLTDPQAVVEFDPFSSEAGTSGTDRGKGSERETTDISDEDDQAVWRAPPGCNSTSEAPGLNTTSHGGCNATFSNDAGTNILAAPPGPGM